MDIELTKLMERISLLRDDELWNISHLDSAQYRPEAITYAKAELARRGISSYHTEPITTPMPLNSIAGFGRWIVRTIRLRAFYIGFLCAISLFVRANYNSYLRMYEGTCDDCFVYFGYPFDLYQTGGFAGPTLILWSGLILDVGIAMLTGICVGLIFKMMLKIGGAIKGAA